MVDSESGAWPDMAALANDIIRDLFRLPGESATQTYSIATNLQQSTFGSGNDAFDDDDYFETYTHLRSPTQTAYPDPAEFGGCPTQEGATRTSSHSPRRWTDPALTASCSRV